VVTSTRVLLLLRTLKEAGTVTGEESLTLVFNINDCAVLTTLKPAWNQDANIPLSKEEIEDVLIDLANKFGFQKGESLSQPPPANSRLFT
jgi:hypothetical protein